MLKNTVSTLIGLALMAPAALANPSESHTEAEASVSESDTLLAQYRPRPYYPGNRPTPYRPAPIRSRPVVVRPAPIVVAPVEPVSYYYTPEFHLGIGLNGSALIADEGGFAADMSGGFGFDLNFGWRIVDEFSLDFTLLFNDLPSDYIDTTGGTAFSFTVDGRYFVVPADQRAQPYVQLGMGYYSFGRDDLYDNLDGFGFNLGGGVDFYLSRGVSIGAKALYRGAFVDNSNNTYPYGATISEFMSLFTFGADLKFHF